MPVPKHKVAKCKTRMRRSIGYYNLQAPGISLCPNCGSRKLSHRVCPVCGYYKGKQILTRTIHEEA
ncbi:MAG: 50S ribosomal protein L32 [Brevinematales bacterium]